MPMPIRNATCDIVVCVYDQPEYTQNCISSILKHTDYPFRLIIVDNGSKEERTLDLLKEIQSREPERVTVIRNEKNQGYVLAANRGLENTSAEYVVIMNNDVIAYPGWLSEMILIAEKDPAIGIVNPQWEVRKRFKGDRDEYFKRCVTPAKGVYIEEDWARGCCYLTKRAVIDKIGGLDVVYSPGYYDDWDYSMRAISKGFKCVCALGSFVFHFGNVTYSVCGEKDLINTLLKEKGALFYKKWGIPLKLLIASNGISGEKIELLKRLLLGQNRITLISTEPIEIKHTNLEILQRPHGLHSLTLFFLLINDMRHSTAKRFHLVIAEGRLGSVLRKIFPFYSHASLISTHLLPKIAVLKHYE